MQSEIAVCKRGCQGVDPIRACSVLQAVVKHNCIDSMFGNLQRVLTPHYVWPRLCLSHTKPSMVATKPLFVNVS